MYHYYYGERHTERENHEKQSISSENIPNVIFKKGGEEEWKSYFRESWVREREKEKTKNNIMNKFDEAKADLR